MSLDFSRLQWPGQLPKGLVLFSQMFFSAVIGAIAVLLLMHVFTQADDKFTSAPGPA